MRFLGSKHPHTLSTSAFRWFLESRLFAIFLLWTSIALQGIFCSCSWLRTGGGGGRRWKKGSIYPTSYVAIIDFRVISEGYTLFINFQKPLTADVDKEKRRPSVDRAQNIDDTGTEIAAILCTRSNVERLEIARVYLAKYGEELFDTLHQTFTGEFGELIHALLESPVRYDAGQLHRAITSTSVFTVRHDSVE